MSRYRYSLVLAAVAVAALAAVLTAPGQQNAPQPAPKPAAEGAGEKGKKPPEEKQPPAKPGVLLTVYDSFALVKDRRELPDVFKKGLNVIHFRDVAATLDPTSVHFRSLTDPQAQVLEQNYEFDLVSADKLLQKYIDQKITVHVRDGKAYEGILLSYDSQRLVLAGSKDKGPIFLVERGENVKRIQFSKLPEGLLTRPTLVWEVEARKPGKHLIEVSYIANQLAWRADYNLVLKGDDQRADLSGWVTIKNHSGVAYANAAVKLLAGQTHPDYEQMPWGSGPEYYKLMRTLPLTDKVGSDPSRTLGDYRVYQLPETTTIANNQIKQVELIKAAGVPVTRTYLYDGAKLRWYRYAIYEDAHYGLESNKKVNVVVELKNTKDDNLGISLPQGKVRVYKQDADGALEFIGEDLLANTTRDEAVALYVGDAFDIVGERRQTAFKRLGKKHISESFEIKIRNHKKEEVTVKVLEKLYRTADWRIPDSNTPHERLDSRTIVFPVRVAPDKEATVTYTVEYRW
ncbi:MAG TPA: hypothetical protein VEL76_39000 [Gemmataceae bacterium]|nr:hypothetical protein [Gemmataceae bacterium]